MKTYRIQLESHGVVTIKAHNIAEAVSKFKHSSNYKVKGWSILDRTHDCPHSSWKTARNEVKQNLNSVWLNHEEVKGTRH